ncbi:DUF484 family protein [Marivivens aquimaris]|uniref:DUF484 family protein n=1 Tax=Marivivens aquimaris TaxID=2774876 RepID=UPI00187E25AA|nr:DUF484 family protein [Marivivens aquimaris]
MSGRPQIDSRTREMILSDPGVVLDDKDLMQALVAGNERAMGNNIVDLRGIAMSRLETRLDRLEETHRNVIAAAYDNLAGTNQIHRATLRVLEVNTFEEFIAELSGEIPEILRLCAMRLVLESGAEESDPAVQRLDSTLRIVPAGFVDDYLTRGRQSPIRYVTLRQVVPQAEGIYGDKAADIRSEACLRLDLGQGRLPAMLAMGAEDPHQFTPQQGTDLLAFFGGVFERAMRRWLD